VVQFILGTRILGPICSDLHVSQDTTLRASFCIFGLSSPYSRDPVTYFFSREVPKVNTPPYLCSLKVNTPPYWGRHPPPYGVPTVETLPIFSERNLDFTKSSRRMPFSSLRIEILLPVNTDNGSFPAPFRVSTPFNSTGFLRTDGGYPKCSKDAGVPSFAGNLSNPESSLRRRLNLNTHWSAPEIHSKHFSCVVRLLRVATLCIAPELNIPHYLWPLTST